VTTMPDITSTRRRVLVTGASGFLGDPLCRLLRARGAEVHGISRVEREPGPDRPRWWRTDVEDAGAVRDLVAQVRPDVLYHLSGRVNGAPDAGLVLPTFHSLLTSTINVLVAASEAGCQRVVLVGSPDEPEGPADAVPLSPYGAAKWAASGYGRMFHRAFHTPVVIARVFMTYGPAQPEWKVIPYSILALLDGQAPAIRCCTRGCDWVYIDDVADGLYRAGCVPGIEGRTVELGTGRATRIRDVVERIATLLGSGIQPVFETLEERLVHPARVADTQGALSTLGWSPAVGLDDGLRRTVEWFRGLHQERRMPG
jgi:UDP-glucose 4-epimerase